MSVNQKAIINANIFDGVELLENHALIFSGSEIDAIIPQQAFPEHIEVVVDLQDGFLTPGFIDLQVNGGGGKLFNNDPSLETIRTIGEAHREFGTTGFMPTLITDDFSVMREAVGAVNQAIDEGVPGVLGIHLEGPFLNEDKKGAHDASKFCVLDDEGFSIISSLKNGKTIVTLAPELTSTDMIRRISDAGIIICAGHSGADFDQANAGLAAGVNGFTHLYNAMTPLQSRSPGMVGAALNDENSWFGIIADGFHMHPAAFRVAVAAKQKGGAILVSDAMPTVGYPEKKFTLDGETIHAIDGRCMNAAGSLAGSDLDMISAVNNAAKFARIDWFEAVRMASVYPAAALGLDDRIGYLQPGYAASFLAFDQNKQITQSWIEGVSR